MIAKVKEPAAIDYNTSKITLYFEVDEIHFEAKEKLAKRMDLAKTIDHYRSLIPERVYTPIELCVLEQLGIDEVVHVDNKIYLKDGTEIEASKVMKELTEDNLPYCFHLYIPYMSVPFFAQEGKNDYSRIFSNIYYDLNPPEVSEIWIKNWFSNMTRIAIPLVDSYDIEYWTVENYYQAMKTEDRCVREKLAINPPNLAKLFWKHEKNQKYLKQDWQENKQKVMFYALKHKFTTDTLQQSYLHSTGIFPIIEFNNWNDRYWGNYIRDFSGKNILGKMLTTLKYKLFYQEIPY